MSALPIRRAVPIGEGPTARTVVVRELTLAEFRAWFAAAARDQAVDAFHALLLEDCSLADVAAFTDLQMSEIEDLTPSQMRAVWAEVQEVNQSFFTVLGRLREARAASSSSSPSSKAAP